jgi:hypothetical protein
MTCDSCKDKIMKKEIPTSNTFQSNKSISADYSLFQQNRNKSKRGFN